MKKNRYIREADKPFYHPDHKRPVTRRDFLAQGFTFGSGVALGGSMGLFSNQASALSGNLDNVLSSQCGGFNGDNAKIPFICFDLAGGANFACSSVLVGGQGGQRDFISSSGYLKRGLPADMTPNLDSATNPLIDDTFGLLFHENSMYLRGLREKCIDAAPNMNGAIITARSENDTGNNPHNPMYAINRYATSNFDAGGVLLPERSSSGNLLSLIGSRASESGGNSLAPMDLIEAAYRPTKVDRASDVTGLVDTGDLTTLLGQTDTVDVMESMYRLSLAKLNRVNTGVTTDADIKNLVSCGYLNSAGIAERYGDPSALNPDTDPEIVGPTGIFSQAEYDREREFRKTAAIMKLVVNGDAGAGCVTMGGYDYHGGRRARGEMRDLNAGRCIGACLEYARRRNQPLMVYVFSDGSVSSNGMIDDSQGDGLTGVDQVQPGGGGKTEWTSDNQQGASSWFMVYNPNGRPQILGANPEEQARHQQIGWFRQSGDVETGATPMSNNVNLLVRAVVANYMALHNDLGKFTSLFGNVFGDRIDDYIAMEAIYNGNINTPI